MSGFQSFLATCVAAAFAVACEGTIGPPGTPSPLDEPSQVPSDGKLVPFVPSGAPASGAEFDCADPARQDPGPYLIRRLTATEYMNTVRAVLGVDISDLAALLPADQSSDGFVNNASVQVTTYDHIEAYAQLAEKIVLRIPNVATLVQDVTDCIDFRDPCKGTLLENLGLRLHRRPLGDLDRAALLPLFDAVEDDGGTFLEAASLVLTALLQSPRFLYRVEGQVGGPGPGIRPLDGYEIATRLSYLLWGSAPDAALLAAAQRGTLGDPREIRAQVERMLAMPEAQAGSLLYLHGWLGLERLPRLQTELKAALREETEAFFRHVVWELKGEMPELLTSKLTYASEDLARFYGLPNPRAGLQRYDLGGVPNRTGLLTQGSVLSAGGSGASVVHRGLFIRANFLCAQVPAPPPGVNNGRPEPQPGKSQREYAEERIATSPCSSCHGIMDALAFPFTVFDDYGAPQAKDSQGNLMETDGQFVFPYDQQPKTFKNADEFIRLLAEAPRMRDCMVLKPARFALGRAVNEADRCTLRAVRDTTKREGLTYGSVMRALATQPAFRSIRSE